uniref:ZrgA family zinc uptake protein n=1 Tax=Vibrio mexicanus TaxID=1004326 RepID=UPI00063C4B42
MTVKTKLAVVTALALSTSAFAAQEYRQHGAHVHGVVEFNIAQDGHDLLVEITAPGADVVGFEHAPTNEKEEQAIAAANVLLKQSDKIITLSSAAECHIEATHVSNTLTGDDHGHDDHKGHDHDHDHHD